MNLIDTIKIYENALPEPHLHSFLKWVKMQKYDDAMINRGDGKNTLDKSVRDVGNYGLHNFNHESQTRVHWLNYFIRTGKNAVLKYGQDVAPAFGTSVSGINDISVLKYEQAGHYQLHHDDSLHTPRTISLIMFLNDDYEGGVLNFASPINGEIIKSVKPKRNSMILWPSNFLFPHGVQPVTRGTRYVLVLWAR